MLSKSYIDSVDRIIRVFGFSISQISTNVFGEDGGRLPTGKIYFNLIGMSQKASATLQVKNITLI
jgi:hypothetical protein